MQDDSLSEIQKHWHGSLESYITGYFASLILTITSFFLVFEQMISTPILVYILIGLAIIQALGQLLFFMHISKEVKPYWETIVFLVTLVMLIVIVAGSLWVMTDLNDRMMPDMSRDPMQEMHYD